MISQAIIQNQHLIESASITEGEVEIQVKPEVSLPSLIILYSDLVVLLNPKVARLNLMEKTIQLVAIDFNA